MKKRYYIIIFFVFLICTFFFFNSSTNSPSSILSGPNETYYCYYTNSTKEYLDFLENFEDETYEIFDISHNESYWYVTYKLKE